METFLPEVLSGTALVVAVIVYNSIQAVARLIPDDKGGWLGVVRKIAKVLTMYTVNKKTDAG